MRSTENKWILIFCMTLLVSTSAAFAGSVSSGSYLKSYISSIDGTSQPYGLYIPTTYNSYSSHPVIFTGHGFGGHADSTFTAASSFADAHGCILVKLEGRGDTFYDGPGEVDFYEVLQDLRAKYSIDENHLYFEGSSMGATGAYRLGIRHPDVFAAVGGCDGWADYRLWYKHWYAPLRDSSYVEPFRVSNLETASPVDIAENSQWLSSYLIVDTYDSTVEPANTYNLDSTLKTLASQASDGGFIHRMQQINGGHGAGYSPNLINLYNYFLTKSRNQYPAHVTINTERLKYGKVYWASIDRLQTVNEFATLDARITGNNVAVIVDNALQFTLRLDANLVDTGQIVYITINGASVEYSGPAGTITLYAILNGSGSITGWSTSDPTPNNTWKTSTIEGPIGHAYTSKFLVAYGTDPNDLAEANTFCNNWDIWMESDITPKPAAAITPSDIASSNLILFGSANTNSYLQAIQAKLPIKVNSTGITMGGKQYNGSNYGAYFIYPNPNNPLKYIVVSHKIIPGSAPKDLEALPWYWPDYVIFDTNKSAGASVQSDVAYLPDTFVDSGYFDSTWSLAGGMSTAAAPVFSPGAGSSTGLIMVTINCDTAGVEIHYTTDGSDPTAASPAYIKPISILHTTTLKALAIKTGMNNSAVAAAQYVIIGDVYDPDNTPQSAKSIAPGETQNRSISLPGDVDWVKFTLTQLSEVTIQTNGPRGDTRLWLYGPNSSSSLIAFNDDYGSTTFSRIDRTGINALGPGTYYALITSFNTTSTIPQYSLTLTVKHIAQAASPVISPTPGNFGGAVTVTLSCATPGATIHYTLNGSTPTSASPIYQKGISIANTSVIKAIASESGMIDSPVASGTFIIQNTLAVPILSPAPGTYTGTVTVAIFYAIAGAVIRYTKDGTTPTQTSPLYTAPLVLTGTSQIKVKAFKTGTPDSAVTSGVYMITAPPQLQSPSLNPASSTYKGSVKITMVSYTSGAAIRYTTDGTIPTSASLLYSGLITLTQTKTIRAAAFKSGMTTSPVTSVTYTIVNN